MSDVPNTPIVKEVITKVEPKYAKRTIEMTGLETCGGCIDAETFVKTELIPNSDVPTDFTKIDANSEAGKKIVEEKDLEFVPHFKECLIPSDPTKEPECRDIKEFKKGAFKTKVNEI